MAKAEWAILGGCAAVLVFLIVFFSMIYCQRLKQKKYLGESKSLKQPTQEDQFKAFSTPTYHSNEVTTSLQAT